MTERQKNIQILNREPDGFTATIQKSKAPRNVCRICGLGDGMHEDDCPDAFHRHNPATCHHCQANRELANQVAFGQGSEASKTEVPGAHTCLAANCGTLLDPGDYFCDYHFQKIPDDLLGLYAVAPGETTRQLLLQQMADHFKQRPSDDSAELALGVCKALVTWAELDQRAEGGCFEKLASQIVPLAAQAVRLAEGQ